MDAQLNLWNDVRMPETFHQHFKQTGLCINCRMPLRHPMHAFNHFKKFHAKAPQPQYFVWNGRRWVKSNLKTYQYARQMGQATAKTKREAYVPD